MQLPGLDGLGCLEALAEHHPQVKVAMLSAVEDTQVIESAFRRGAHGYILKAVNPFDLPAAIRQIVDESVIHRPLARATGPTASRSSVLSEKEVAVLVELCHGHTNKQIAAQLWLSEQTVKFHLRNIYRKLGIKSRTEALRYAYEHDLAIGSGRLALLEHVARREPDALALAGGELEHGPRALRGRHPPGPERRPDRDDAPLVVEEDDVDREAHEVRVHGARPREEQPLAGG